MLNSEADVAEGIDSIGTDSSAKTALAAYTGITKLAASKVVFGKSTITPTGSNYVKVTDGATTTIESVAKGNALVTLNATVDGVPVVANPISVNVVNNVQKYEVHFETGYDEYNHSSGTEAQIFREKYDYPNYNKNLALRTGFTVSEVEATVSGDKVSNGFYLMDVPEYTKFVLPTQEEAFGTSVDPFVSLYGWDVNGSYYKIGDSVTITTWTTVSPLFGYKYQNGIKLYRYSAGTAAGTALTNASTITIAKSTSGNTVTIPLAAGYNVIDVEKGPSKLGAAQYKSAMEYDNSAKLIIREVGDELLNQNQLKANILQADSGLGSGASVEVSYQDIAGNADAIYSKQGSGAGQIAVKNLTVKSTDAKAYTITLDSTATIQVGQTKTLTATVKDEGGNAVNWGSMTAVATVSSNKEVATASAALAANSDIKVTGVAAGNATISVTATDVNGNDIKAQIAVTVGTENIQLIPTVSNTAVTGEVQDGTIYLQAGVANTLSFQAYNKTTGSYITQSTADWSIVGKTVDSVSAGDAISYITAVPTTISNYTASITPDALGIGTLEATYTNGADVYVKSFPVMSYQAVVVHAPATANASTYSVSKSDTALEATKNDVTKVTYISKDTAEYTFDSAPYSFKWLKSSPSYSPYYWADTLDIDGNPNETKVIDLGKKITDTAANWALAQVDLYPAFGPLQVEKLLDVPKEIVLSDEAVESATVKGTNMKAVKIGVSPYATTAKVEIGGADNGMHGLVAGDKTKDGAYAAPVEWNGGSVVDITTAGSGTSREDVFTVGMITDGAMKHVGTTTLYVYTNQKKASTADAVETITVYLNGEYTDTTVTPNVKRYKENGVVIENGSKTVKGKTHWYKDKALLTSGVYEVETGKFVIVNGNGDQTTTEGKTTFKDQLYYIGSDGFVKTGLIEGTNGKTYYADATTGVLVASEIVEIGGAKYYFNKNGEKAVASSSANTYELESVDKKYYIDANGNIAMTGIFKVAGVDRLFKEDGSIVTFADTTDGKITVNGIVYVLDKVTNEAKPDDILYDATVTWTTSFPTKITKGTAAPELEYTINYKSKNGNTVTPVKKTVTAVPNGSFSAESTATELTFTATPDLTGFFADAEGTTPATADPKVAIYRFKDGGLEGISDIWYAPTVAWTTTWPAKWTKDPVYPTMKYKVTYTSKETGTQVTTDELTATVTSIPATIASDAKEATFTATADLSAYYTDDTGATVVDPTTIANSTSSKKYIFKDGGAEGVAGTYSIKSKTAFTWGELPTTGVPTASLSITYTVTQEDGTKTTETVTTNATVTETTAAGDTKHRSFKAVAATMDEKNPEITDTKIYSVKSGSGMEGIVIEGLQDEYEFAGTPIQPAFYLVDYDIEDGVVLALGTDYTAKYTNNKAAGTGTITITGKGNYAGKNLTASFKIVDPFAEADKTDFADNVKKVVVSKDGFTYDGTQKFPKTVTITTKAGETIVYEFDGTSYNKTQGDKEVLITVANNVKAGTATVGAQGKSDAKPKTGKFKIAPLDLAAAGDKLAVTINDGDNAVYEVKGVQPSVEAVYTSEDGDSVLLVQGQDYTLSYKNNKAAGTGTALLKGKKNCSGKKEASFTIDPIDLSQVDTDTVSVLALSGKKVSKVKAVVTDAAGNVIPAKQLTVSIFEAGGDTALAKSAVVPAAFDVKIEANGTNLKDSLEIADLKPVNDFKAKITVDKNWKLTYTGEPIILTDLVDDNNANPFENGKITVKVGSATLVYGEDFEVAGYANNIKTGSMSFTLYGIGNYAGSKSGKVKIVAKTVSKIVAE